MVKTRQSIIKFTEEDSKEFNSIIISEEEAYNTLKESKTLYLDLETNGLDPLECQVVTVQMMNEYGDVALLKDPDSLDLLRPLLESALVIGHNLKFDTKFLKHHYDLNIINMYDTYLAEIAISGGKLAGRKGASLKDLVHKYCGVELDKTEQTRFHRGEALTEAQEQYAINDLKYLPTIVEMQKKHIDTMNLRNIIDIEMKCIPGVVWLELSGMNINLERVAELRAQLVKQRLEAQDKLYQTFGTSKINLNSPLQMVKMLNKHKIPVCDISEEELSKYSDQIIDTLKAYKGAEKLLNTFVEKIPTFISKKTGRIHASFNQYGAKSGRFTSSKPNMQQQPSKFKEWRSVYQATPGWKIVASDYSQIELRILAQISGEQEYINAYNAGADLHKLTASKIFKISPDEVTSKQRSMAKTVNFGLAYGMWTFGLIGNLNKAGISVTEDEAEKTINGFYEAYPQVAKYLKTISETGLRNLQVKTEAGRICKFDYPQDEQERGSIKRESKNLPIQGLCADMVKSAIGNIYLSLEPLGVRFINTIHDELVFECREKQAVYVARVVKEEMEKAGRVYLKDLPCIADTKILDCWEK